LVYMNLFTIPRLRTRFLHTYTNQRDRDTVVQVTCVLCFEGKSYSESR